MSHSARSLASKALAALIVVFALTGCFPKFLYQPFVQSDQTALALHYIDVFIAGDVDAIYAKLDPSIINSGARSSLAAMSRQLPKERRQHYDLIGSVYNVGPQGTFHNITFQLQYPNRWLVGSVYLKNSTGTSTIAGLHFVAIPGDLSRINAFTLTGKSAVQYIVLILAVVFPIFSLWTLITVIRTPMNDRKWFWVLVVLLPVSTFRVDWTTGQWDFVPLAALALGAGVVTSSPYSPWILSVSPPLGAIAFWLTRPWILKQAAQRAEMSESADSATDGELETPLEGHDKPGERFKGQWNWGAFFLAPLWLIDHGYAWYGILIICVAFVPFVDIVCLAPAILCGIKGNEIAIKRRKYSDESEFVFVQNAWRNWGILAAIGIPLFALFALVLSVNGTVLHR